MKKGLYSLLVLIFLFVFFQIFVLNKNEQVLSVQATQIELEKKEVTLEDGEKALFSLASGFDVSVAVEGLEKPRFMAYSPDGRLFVPDMITNYGDNRQGKIYILEDFDSETKKFQKKTLYLSGLRNPHSVAFYTDRDGKHWLYVSVTDRLIRYLYKEGDERPQGEPELIFSYPTRASIAGDVSHITRTIIFNRNSLYISIGSSCNVCEETEDYRAEIIKMTPIGEDVKTYARGLRNAVGMVWVENQLYATGNGVDHLGSKSPDDLIYKIEEGRHYGFPYCYEIGKEIKVEDSQNWKKETIDCDDVPTSFVSLDPHSAPLGIMYFKTGASALQESFLVALHGSFNINTGNGYSLLKISSDGKKEIFMSGFLSEEGVRIARPVYIIQKDNDSFFFSDDYGGRIFYVYTESK